MLIDALPKTDTFFRYIMRLADFISDNPEPILAEWVEFAATCGPVGSVMDLAGLREHARAMLERIVEDLRTPQTDAEQNAKGKGLALHVVGARDTVAETHGAGRAVSGFTAAEMVSEYRALRASVIRLWTKANGTLTGADLEDLMRFNETVDQALAESIERFMIDIERARDTFIAVLGHDLRSPLGAVVMASQFMLDTNELVEPHLTLTTRIARSGRRMDVMVGDLLDFTRGRLGSGVPIIRGDMELTTVVRNAVEEVGSAHPEAQLQLSSSGDLNGRWDSGRVSQVVTNLLINAVSHGSKRTTISVTVQGETDDVVLRVHNYGAPIPPGDIPSLFSPFKRLQFGDSEAPTDNMGLGLYIVERIAIAHGGSIDVRSSEEAGTLFTVRLPR